MVKNLVALFIVVGFFSTARADSTPKMLGNLKATLHLICGKKIEIQIAEMSGNDKGRTLLGLKNKKTDKVDLFVSSTNNAENKQYDQYIPVAFDILSKSFIADIQERPNIVWGGAVTDLKGVEYSLALGSHVYQCGKLDKFFGEVANDLYGETENTTD